MSRRRVAIMISGGGSNMASLVNDMRKPDHPAMPVIVVADNPEAGGLAKAKKLGVATACVDHRRHEGDAAAFERDLARTLAASEPDIICLAGFMRVLTAGFVARWQGMMLNIHPSILPMFRGLHTHERVLEAGMAVHGCTVHEVTPELDGGPIFGQAVIAVEDGDTVDTLAARLLPLEHKLYCHVLHRFATGDRRKIALT